MSSKDGNDRVQLDPRIDLFAGAVAGIAALTVGFPFDTGLTTVLVKVRLQSPEVAARYRSTLHAFTTIVREERIRGLFRGITSPLLTMAPLNGVVFASYRFLLKLQLAAPDAKPTLTQVTLAGMGCGLLASIVTSPTELIKIQQQTLIVPKSGRAPSVGAVAAHIWRTRGPRGLFRGAGPTAARELGYGAYFGVYEGTLALYSRLSRPRPAYTSADYAHEYAPTGAEAVGVGGAQPHPYWALLLAGGLAGPASWLVTFPFDVVKTRVQSVIAPGPDHPYRNTLSTIVSSYRAEGAGVFFRGLWPTMLRAIPVNMVTFATFEAVVRALT